MNKIILIFFIIILLTSCGVRENTGNTIITNTPIVVNEPTASTYLDVPIIDYVISPSVADLSKNSILIVTGVFAEKKDIINMARNTSDINSESTDIYGIGQVYSFSVNEVISGEDKSNKNIDIVFSQGMFDKNQKSLEDNIKDTKTRYSQYIINIEFNKKYVVFLNKFDTLDDREMYIGNITPWLFSIDSNNNILAETKSPEAAFFYSGYPYDKFLEQVRNPDASIIDVHTKQYTPSVKKASAEDIGPYPALNQNPYPSPKTP